MTGTYDVTAPFPDPRRLRAIEASAGTGKTYSITTTVVRLVVEDDLTLDRLLVATFTRAATADLRKRLRERLTEALRVTVSLRGDGPGERDDDVLVRILQPPVRAGRGQEVHDRLVAALGAIDEATISTIHGFCQRVLTRAAFASGVETGLRLDTDDQRLVEQIVDDWTVALLHDADDDLLAATELLKLTPSGLRRIGLAIAGEPDPHPVPDVDPVDPRTYVAEAHAALRRVLDDPGAEAALLAAAQRSVDDKEQRSNGKWAPSKLPPEVASLRRALETGTAPPKKALARLHPEWDTGALRDGTGTMPAGIAATAIPQAVDAFVRLLTDAERAVRTQLAAHVRDEVDARRTADGSASFADLLRELDHALARDSHGHLTSELRATYDAVLVDEFQDTDPVQWRILHRLFGEGRHFDIVGDPKQAIYAWRGADLATYLQAVEEAGDQLFTMGTNHRSDGAYVEACNALFRGDDSFTDPGEDDGDRVAYQPVGVRDDHVGHRLWDGDEGISGLAFTFHARVDDSAGFPSGELQRNVATHAAAEIVDAIDGDLTLEADEGPRPVGPGDIAVLTRTKHQARSVLNALQERGVPAVLGGGRDVLETPEADEVAALLTALLSPADERAVRRVLVGPFAGRDAGELDTMADAELTTWFDRMAAWSRAWQRDGVAGAVATALREGGGETWLARQRSGERTLTNLRHLAEVLHRAEQEESLGPAALASWFATRRAEAAEGEIVRSEDRELRLERDAHAVRVMTIHTSKGLEFPLVWLPFLWHPDVRKVSSDTRVEPFAVNDPQADGRRTLSLHPAALDPAVVEGTEHHRLREVATQAEYEGGHRLAYVALTRAVHRTVVHVAGSKELEASSLWHLLCRHTLGPGGPDRRSIQHGDDALRACIDALVAAAPDGTVHVGPSQHGPAPLRRLRTRVDPDVDEELRRARWTRRRPLDVRWGRASYSGLVAGGVVDVVDVADHDGGAVHDTLAPLAPEERTGDPVPLQDIERSARMGTFVHDVLEHADFAADVPDLRTLVARRARVSGIELPEGDDEVLARGLRAALTTPLGPELGGLTLAEVRRGDRLDELEFVLALASRDEPVDLLRLADVFDAHATGPDGPLLAGTARVLRRKETAPVHGLLGGFIDLVFRERTTGHDRWWIADYKTNGLGDRVQLDERHSEYVETAAHQHPSRVEVSMVRSGYVLQAHLYVVALHRWLRARLGDGYDPARELGGWTYLYLRGMTGPAVATTAEGRPHGVRTGRPTMELIDDLDRVLGGAP